MKNKSPLKSYLGKTVNITVDRPLGCPHPKFPDTIYPINYGYISNTLAGDGEEIDVYLLGIDHPVSKYTAKIIGIVHRMNDTEDKLIAAPAGLQFHQAKIAEAIHFQEKYFITQIESLYEKSCGAIVFRRRKETIEYLCLLQTASGIYTVPKGHMEAFEDEEQTAKREIWEEAGIAVQFISDFRVEMRYIVPGHKKKLLVLFLAEYHAEPRIDHNEITHYDWLPLNQILNTLPKGYHNVIRQAHQLITKKHPKA